MLTIFETKLSSFWLCTCSADIVYDGQIISDILKSMCMYLTAIIMMMITNLVTNFTVNAYLASNSSLLGGTTHKLVFCPSILRDCSIKLITQMERNVEALPFDIQTLS